MRRRQLVATAAAGAVCAALATLSVTAGPVVSRKLGPSSAPAAYASTIRHDLPAYGMRRAPLVIAHRGASAYHAEHTLEAYRMAIAMGADYVEADLVVTRDGQLVARHENDLSATTDVAHHPEFAARRVTKQVDGSVKTNWFAEDFTLAELKTLRAVPRAVPLPPGAALRPATGASGAPSTNAVTVADTVPSLQEIIDLVHEQSVALGRPIGLYLELKFPAYFAARGLAPEPLLAAALRRNHLDSAIAPVFVESFDAASLRTVHKLLPVPLIQLMSGAGGPNDAATLAQVPAYASGVGVDRARLKSLACASSPGQPNFVQLMHKAGLEVHVYTFANTTVSGPLPAVAFRPGDPSNLAEPLAEYRAYFRIGVDGIFTDNPDVAVRARG